MIVRLIDAHCHLQADIFSVDLEAVVSRARGFGVIGMINASTSPDDWSLCRSVSERFLECEFALGIHPWYIPDDAEHFLASRTADDFSGAIAVGEIGIDNRKKDTDPSRERSIFRAQLEIAREIGLPVIIHCLGAWNDLATELKRIQSKRGGIIHNFNGSGELAKELIKYGLSFSVGGTATYRDSRKRAEMIRTIYPDYCLLETDSPDIPPAEKKGMRNEPSNIIYVLSALSEILDISEEGIAETTSCNAARIFNRPGWR
jgi:TatD DNase family protein